MISVPVHDKAAHDDGHGRAAATGDKAEGFVFLLDVVEVGDEDGKASGGDGDSINGEEKAAVVFIGSTNDEPGIDEARLLSWDVPSGVEFG